MIKLTDIHGLASSDELAQLIEKGADRRSSSGAFCFGISANDKNFFVNIENGRVSVGDGTDPVELGCIAKVVTATLVTRLLGAPRAWGDRLLAVPGAEVFARGDRLLRDIEPAHLLNHTHGLDDSLLDCVARPSGSEIDVDALLEGIDAGGAVSRPGALHSYSNVGAWLWAALLEHKTGSSFGDLVRSHVATPLGLESFGFQGPRVCSAGLLPMSLSIEDLLRLCRQHDGAETSDSRLSELRASKVDLPGWSLGERAACQAWKFFGEGWYGHNAQSPEYSGIVRTHPDSRTTLAVFGDGIRLFSLVTRLFSRMLPEFMQFRPPRQLSQAEAGELQLDHFEGTYRTAALEISVERSDGPALRYATKAQSRSDDKPRCTTGILVPAKQNLFLSKERSADGIPFLQFVNPGGNAYQHAWNGRNVFRRVGFAT